MSKEQIAYRAGFREAMARALETAANPGFVEARDTEWDEGFNYAKRYISEAIYQRAIVAEEGLR